MNKKIWLVLGLILSAAIFSLFYFKYFNPVSKETFTKSTMISDEEKKQIDQWLVKNKLNSYGDPPDTVYTGGTPLFDERTGQYTDKYEYILKRHPDLPWRK